MSHNAREQKTHRYRSALRAALILLAFVLLMPLVPYGLAASGVQLNNPGAELWRAVRQRVQEPASTQVQNIDGTVLINPYGEEWRLFRADKLVPIGGWILLGTLAAIALFFLVRGRIRIEGGRSGKLVPRFSER